MPTAASWTEVRRAVTDVAYLIDFRTSTVRRPRAFALGAAVFVGLTVAAGTLPAMVDGAGTSKGYSLDAVVLIPTAMAGFMFLAIASSVASGGGRELLHREHAVIYPVSPTTDHLGALLLAPLNIAWLLQAWILMGITAYGVERRSLLVAEIGIVIWIVAATAVGQVVAWTVEAIRRTTHGIATIRSLGLVLAAAAVMLQLTHHTIGLLDSLKTSWLVVGYVDGFRMRWVESIAVELALLVVAVVLGAIPAHLAARRAPRDELRVETGNYLARRLPRSPLAMLVRTDRGSVWRAVPMRRGLAVLAIGPGVVALAGNLDWPQMTILPGLVASGGALLFGVNAWCLDGRGGLWRESLPVGPRVVFAARAWVLTEFLLVASFVTMVLAGLRAGLPERGRADRAPVHLARRGAAGRDVGHALVLAATVRRRPALGARHPGATPGDGGLLDQARGHHHVDEPGLLRAGAGAAPGGLGAGRRAVRRVVAGPPAARQGLMDRSGPTGQSSDDGCRMRIDVGETMTSWAC